MTLKKKSFMIISMFPIEYPSVSVSVSVFVSISLCHKNFGYQSLCDLRPCNKVIFQILSEFSLNFIRIV